MASLHPPRSGLDCLFDALRHPARRRVLDRCRHVERADRGFSPAAVTTDDAPVDQQLVALSHRHLPKLADAGYVDWDPGAETVRPGPRFPEAEPILAFFADHQERLPATWP